MLIEGTRAELAAAFARRRCAVCGAPACVVAPGREAAWEHSALNPSFAPVLVRTSRPDRHLCLAHAAGRWPWPSEAPMLKGAVR